MRDPREIMSDLARSGLSPEQIMLVMELSASLGQPARSARQDRNARYYDAHKQDLKEKRVLNRLKASEPSEKPSLPDDPPASSVNVEDNLTNPPKEKDPKGSQKKTPPKWPTDSFDRIWSAYPHKVGKKAVYAKLALIERSGEARPDEIVDGIERYKLAKPEHHDWKNPLTWLNQGCWADEYGTPAGTGPPTNGRHSPHAPLSNVSRRYAEPANKPRSVHDAARDLDLWAEQVSRTRGH
jgi:hypothetical protein